MYGAAMVVARSRLAVVALAAGAGTRFSDEPGGKLLAELDGDPVLEHVLSAIRSYGPARTIVVLGFGSETVERSIAWAGEERVVNPDPSRGIASSIAVGFTALATHGDTIDGAFIVLGDQPRLRVDVFQLLESHAAGSQKTMIVPRYAGDAGPRNPVLLLRAAWPLVDELDGDHGLGPLIVRRPDLVELVSVPGEMPDVDEPRDLETLKRE
jgi:CTP:molybdopterin cytidylyltransferase MocA